jgi:hypothetical protein
MLKKLHLLFKAVNNDGRDGESIARGSVTPCDAVYNGNQIQFGQSLLLPPFFALRTHHLALFFV